MFKRKESLCQSTGLCQECVDLGKDQDFDICKDGCVRDFPEKIGWWTSFVNYLEYDDKEIVTFTTKEFNLFVWVTAAVGFVGGLAIGLMI